MNRRQFCTYAIGVGLLGSSTSGCTAKMWELANQDSYKITGYQDEINAFYLGQDHESFVVLSDQYHYIFKNSAVAKLLASPLRKFYLVNITNMYMPKAKPGTEPIEGHLVFAVRIKDLSQEELQQAEAMGFHSTHGRDSRESDKLFNKWGIPTTQSEEFLVSEQDISGQRYLPKEGVDYGNKQTFFHKYVVSVDQYRGVQSNSGKKFGAALLTPITVLGDGAMLLLGLPLLPILIPMLKGSAGLGVGP